MSSIDHELIAKKTGYSSVVKAINDYQQKHIPNAAWYCLEIVTPMVKGVSRLYLQYQRNMKSGNKVEAQDLEQEAYHALIQGLAKFTIPDYAIEDDVACAKAWNRYASVIIKTPVRDVYSSSINAVEIPGWALKIAKKINVAIAEIEAEMFNPITSGTATIDAESDKVIGVRTPSAEQVAAKARLPISRVRRFLAHGLNRLPQNRFTEFDESGGIKTVVAESSIRDTVDVNDPAIQLEADELKMLTKAMTLLDDKERTIVSMHFGIDGPRHTVKKISEQTGLTIKQVRLVEEKAIRTMQEFFTNADEDGDTL